MLFGGSMQKHTYQFATMSAAMLAALAATAQAQRVRDVSDTVELFQSIPEVAAYFESAYGYAVWPRIAQGGLGIGASRGRGQVYVGGQFEKLGGQTRNGLAKVAGTTGGDLGWIPNPTLGGGGGLILAIKASGKFVYVGGAFTDIANPPGSRSCQPRNIRSAGPP